MRKIVLLLLILFALSLLKTASAEKKRLSTINTRYVPGILLIKFKAQGPNFVSSTTFNNVVQQIQAKKTEQLFPDLEKRKVERDQIYDLSKIYKFYVNDTEDIEKICIDLNRKPGIAYAEPVYIFKIDKLIEPNDTFYRNQQHLPQIKAPEAWDVITGDSTVIVAIMDSGVDWDHPDLAANIWKNKNEIIDGIDNDGNGKIDDIRGWDWVNGLSDAAIGEDGSIEDNDPMDFNGHGTHLAGDVAAITNNGIGVASVSWNCQIMSLRVGWESIDGGGYIRMDWLAKALRYAADNGAHVANISTGSSLTVVEAARYAVAAGMVITKSAGNSNDEYGDPLDLEPNIISVAAVDDRDFKASYSTYGIWVKVSAPGGDLSRNRPGIFSTDFNDQYSSWQGTSFSAPITAGLAALIKSQHPDWNPFQIVRQIVLTADNIDNLNPQYADKLGSGRINAFRAVTETNPAEIAPKIKLIGDVVISDANGGDNDNIFERGETIEVKTSTYRNYSISPGLNVVFTITSDDTDLTINDGPLNFGYFPPDVSLSIPLSFTFTVNQNAKGKTSNLYVGWQADGGYSDADTFKIIIGKIPILVVDDAFDEDDIESPDADEFYTNILDNFKLNYAVWDRYKMGSLGPDQMINFPVVIWLCAWAFPSLDSADQLAISNFLDDGGSLFITGQDIGWDFNDPGGFGYEQRDFYAKYLHAIYYSDDSPVNDVVGVIGDPIGNGMKFTVWQPGLPHDFQFPDEIEPISGATAVFEYSGGQNHKFGIKYKSDHKVVYFGMGLEAIDSRENTPPDNLSPIRTEVMGRVLSWLNFIDHEPLNDTENLTESRTVNAHVTNSTATTDLVAMELFWRKIDQGTFSSIPMIPIGNNLYSAEIPGPGENTTIEYYIKMVNSYYDWTSPPDAPRNVYNYQARPDQIAPTFSHIPLKSPLNGENPRAVSVGVKDNIELDNNSVYLHYTSKTISDSVQLLDGDIAGVFQGSIPPLFAYGDTVSYFFSGYDKAAFPNRGQSGVYSFLVGFDDFESGLNNWIASPDGWGLDRTTPIYSGANSINDSPNQSTYPINRDVTITINFGMDLSRTNFAALRFWTRYSLEINRDFGYIEISNDGGLTWNQLGDALNGITAEWTQNIVSLNRYCGPGNNDVRFRFRMVSDENQGPSSPGWFIDDVQIIEGADFTRVTENSNTIIPNDFALYQNYPNPFNSITTIQFDLQTSDKVSLKIFNIKGELVRMLVQAPMNAGSHTIQWDGKDDFGQNLASGVYFYKLSTASFSATRKLLMIK